MGYQTIEIPARMRALIQYMAIVDPHSINRVAYKFGIPPGRDQSEAENVLMQVYSQYGDAGMREIANNHPDKDLITGASSLDSAQNYHINHDGYLLNTRKYAFADGPVATTAAQPAILRVKSDSSSKLIVIMGILILLYMIFNK